jgi:hypothetical protein
MAVTYNKSNNGQRVVIHANANATVTIVGNNTVSNVTSNSSEIVVNGVINKVWYGSDGVWLIGRGNSTVNAIVGVYTGTGRADYDEGGTLLNISSTGTNLYLTLTSSNGYIMIDMKKNA